jgi:acyl-CoA thioesterase
VSESGLDARLLGFERVDEERLRFVLEPHLCRPDGALFGGTAIAAAVGAMELVAGRPALWATSQIVSSAQQGDVVDVVVEHLARGNNVDQLRVTLTVDERVMVAALGSTATPRRDGISGLGARMPNVTPPHRSEPRIHRGGSWGETGERGQHRIMELLTPELVDGTPLAPGRMVLWARLIEEHTNTAAKLGFLGDMVPVAVCDAAGVRGAGTSLDNSLRVGRLVDSEWVLLDLRGHVAADGYGYGECHLWSPDGVLLGTASQTAKLFGFQA